MYEANKLARRAAPAGGAAALETAATKARAAGAVHARRGARGEIAIRARPAVVATTLGNPGLGSGSCARV